MSWRVVTERTAEVVQAMLDEVPNAFQYCTDGFSIYVGRNYHLGWHLVAHGSMASHKPILSKVTTLSYGTTSGV